MAPVKIAVADDGNKLTYWQPKIRSVLPYTFCKHRSDTAAFLHTIKPKNSCLRLALYVGIKNHPVHCFVI
jgi:hypothetical protein